MATGHLTCAEASAAPTLTQSRNAITLLIFPLWPNFDVMGQHLSSTGQTQSAEQVQKQQNDQDQPYDPDASAPPPSLIPVIPASAAESEQQDNNQHDQ